MKKRYCNKYKIIIILILVFIILMSGIFILSRSNYTGFFILDFFNPIFLAAGRLFIAINFFINIDSPQNITYYNYSWNISYPIPFNLYSNRNITLWNYTLIDMKHSVIINNSVIFTPNTTIYAKRWSNKLIVTGRDHAGNIKSEIVDFYIYINNSSPIILNVSNIYTCEQNNLSYYFNVSDVDEDTIIPVLIPQYPANPFYIRYISNYNYTISTHEIYSGKLTKNDSGGVNAGSKVYGEIIYANDGNRIATKDLNITVIETNNAPVIQPINNSEVWTTGDNSSFYYQVKANDTEDGNQDSGNLSFNISFSGAYLFNISTNGTIRFNPNSSQVGIHNLTVCVFDKGLANPHPNISLCGQNGSKLHSCAQFLLTVSETSVLISPGGGGGGGGGGSACLEKWGCGGWNDCKKLNNVNLPRNLSLSSIAGLKKNCTLINWSESTCGYQTRKCNELNNCKTNKSMPTLIQICYYTINASCYDNILNCHNGSCELLIDCGGPCAPCSTCSDGMKNQGEKGIDCGGPCPDCKFEIPYAVSKNITYLFLLIVLILIIFIILLVRRFNRTRRNLENLRKRMDYH